MMEIPLEFRPFMRLSREGDAEALAPHLRAMDRKEVRVISQKAPLDVLRLGFVHSSPAFTLLFPGTEEVMGMGGIGSPGNVVWLLLHKRALHDRDTRRQFIRMSKKVLRWLLENTSSGGGFMGNVTLPQNTHVLRWLVWMGAVVDRVEAEHQDNPCGRTLARFVFVQQETTGGEACATSV